MELTLPALRIEITDAEILDDLLYPGLPDGEVR